MRKVVNGRLIGSGPLLVYFCIY